MYPIDSKQSNIAPIEINQINENGFQNLFDKANSENADKKNKYQLGLCYFFGHGTVKDLTLAVKWMTLSQIDENTVNNILPEANYQLGYEYYQKKDQESLEKAVSLFKSAAKCNHIQALYALGKCYFDGTGVDKDLKKATTLWFSSAENNDVDSQYALGDCFYRGIGTIQDLKKAVHYFKKAAEGGSSKAHYQLGVCFCNGEGIDKNPVEGVSHLKIAASEGSIAAFFQLGICYYKGEGVEQDYSKAATYFEVVAAVKNPGATAVQNAKDAIAQIYLTGKVSDTKSFNWLINQAEAGNKEAQYQLGLKFYYGVGQPQNLEGAREYFCLAASRGHVNAMLALMKFGLVTIRYYEDSDRYDVINIIDQSLEKTTTLNTKNEVVDWTAENELTWLLQSSNHFQYVIEIDKKVVAFSEMDSRGCMGHFYISNKYEKDQAIGIRNVMAQKIKEMARQINNANS